MKPILPISETVLWVVLMLELWHSRHDKLVSADAVSECRSCPCSLKIQSRTTQPELEA